MNEQEVRERIKKLKHDLHFLAPECEIDKAVYDAEIAGLHFLLRHHEANLEQIEAYLTDLFFKGEVLSEALRRINMRLQ